jgi:integrase/recombinase XerD
MDGKVVALPKRKERLTLREAYRDFRQDRENDPEISQETISTYDQRLEPFLSFTEERGIEDLADVGADDVKAYFTELRTRERAVAITKDGKIERRTTGKRLRPWTLRSHFLSLSAFFNYHLKWRRIDEDPSAAFSVGKDFKVPKTRMYEKFSPSVRQVQAVLDLFNRPDQPGKAAEFRCVRNRTIVFLMASKGLRRSDVLNALLGNVDLDSPKPTMRTWRKGQKKELEEPRIIALQPEHVRALHIYLKVRAELLESKRLPVDSGPLFITDDGAVFSKTAMRRLFDTIRRAMGIPVTPHTLRHFAASTLLKTPGVTVRQVQEMMGHADIRTTLGYSHISLDEVRQAEALADLAGKLLKR